MARRRIDENEQGKDVSDRSDNLPEKLPVLLARDGDVLWVSYPEVKLQLAPYSNVTLGGVSYTTRLRDGERVEERAREVQDFLDDFVLGVGRERLRAFREELDRAKEKKS